MSNIPSDLKYTKSHEWVRVSGDTATIGITDHAQHELTDIVFVELPEKGRKVKAGEACAVVESVKTASDIYAPVSGEIVETNQAVVDDPALVNKEPHGGGWFFTVKLANPADHAVLPEVISKEPLGPMVRHGDDQWFDIVKWTLYAMVGAEELGMTQKNVDEVAKSDKPEVKRAVGTDGNLGEQLGLTKDWLVRIVKAVGNYGEAFERNVGSGSKLGIARGLNQLWSKGGIQYAPPIR